VVSSPLTTLDPRFSDDEAVATQWDDTRRALESAELFWICTVRRDGRPHVTPLVAVWLDEAIHFCTGPSEQKAINLAHNSHVVLTTGCADWESGFDIVVEGDAVRVTAREQLERLADAWAQKWDGRWRYRVGDGVFLHSDPVIGEALVFAVEPRKVFAFGKRPFGQTRHQFQ
jgi:general stress protein 26